MSLPIPEELGSSLFAPSKSFTQRAPKAAEVAEKDKGIGNSLRPLRHLCALCAKLFDPDSAILIEELIERPAERRR